MALTWNQAMFEKYYKWPVFRYNPASGGIEITGQAVTFGRVGARTQAPPEPPWGYSAASHNTYYPDHPLNYWRFRTERLVTEFGIAPASRVLVAGAAFGFLPESIIWWMMQNGRTQAQAQAQVAGLDNSSFIQSGLNAEANPVMSSKVVNRDMRVSVATQSNPQRNALQNAWGGQSTGDFVIVESVDESYTDAERTNAFYTALESYLAAGRPLANVIHVVCAGWEPDPADGGSPAKTLEEWAATRPGHSWLHYEYPMRAIHAV
jgi:hypothetical protein